MSAFRFAFLLLAVIVLAFAALFSRSVSVENYAPVPPEAAWRVLADLDAYGQWHPAIDKVEGRLALDAELSFHSSGPAGARTISATIVGLEENRLLNHFRGIPLWLTYDHFTVITPSEAGAIIVQRGEYSGLGALFLDTDAYADLYKRVNLALANRALSLMPNGLTPIPEERIDYIPRNKEHKAAEPPPEPLPPIERSQPETGPQKNETAPPDTGRAPAGRESDPVEETILPSIPEGKINTRGGFPATGQDQGAETNPWQNRSAEPEE